MLIVSLFYEVSSRQLNYNNKFKNGFKGNL